MNEMVERRQLNIEILRIVAMLMVISLHFLDKGKILQPAEASLNWSERTAWLLEAFSIVAVDVYVLITGYYLNGKQIRIRKLLHLWEQVLFYSWGVFLVLTASGFVGMEELDKYQIFGYIFPILTNHYWFATSYMVLYLLAPFLNAGINRIDKKEYQVLLAGLLIFFSISKTIIPMHLPYDDGGYGILWFVCLYLIGGYLSRYYPERLKEQRTAVTLYLVSVCGVWSSMLGLQWVFMRYGILKEMIAYAYTYNHIFCLMGAVGLFAIFRGTQFDIDNGILRKILLELSGATFGIYLFHEHALIRYQWPKIFSMTGAWSNWGWIEEWLLAVGTVFFLGSIVEIIRRKLMDMFINRKW